MPFFVGIFKKSSQIFLIEIAPLLGSLLHSVADRTTFKKIFFWKNFSLRLYLHTGDYNCNIIYFQSFLYSDALEITFIIRENSLMSLEYRREEKLKLFMSLFKGREDVYAKYWEKNGKSGYSPAYQFDWNEFMKFKAQGGTIKDFSNKKLLPLTPSVIEKHLYGQWIIGIYPLLEDNTSYFVAADFDKENWQEQSVVFVEVCKKHDIPAYLERSRSGNGAHVWIFFQEAYPAYKSRQIMLELIREALNFSVFEKEVSFDRLFPNQDYHTGKGFGNLIALPFQGEAVKKGNNCFIDPNTLSIIENQLEYLLNIQKLSHQELDALYKRLNREALNLNLNPKEGKNDHAKTFSIKIKNQIFLAREKLSPTIIKFLRENLNFLNQEYLIKKKMGKSTFKTEQYFNVIEENKNEIMIPRGFLDEFTAFCENNSIRYEVIDERQKREEIEFKSKIKLYPYQQEALINASYNDFGVIVAPPGSGKTIIGLELVAQKKQPALILVHRKQLFDQWVERIQSFLGIPKHEIGQIYSVKKKIGEKITVAMMQSLVKMKQEELEKLKEKFGIIIVDECHHIPAKTFRAVIANLNSYYLYGLTATPQRKHNDEKLIFVYIGNIISEINNSFSNTDNAKASVSIRETNLKIPFDHFTDDLQILSKLLIFDSSRNQMIAEDIKSQAKAGKKILVLTERKDHVDLLNLHLKDSFETITITGDDSAAKRKSKIAQIKMGHFQVLISTGQLFGEGMDVESLDCLFLVYPFSFEGKLIQYIGRIQRSRNHQMIFDYRDINVEYFEKLFKKRNRYYRKLKRINKKDIDKEKVSLFI